MFVRFLEESEDTKKSFRNHLTFRATSKLISVKNNKPNELNKQKQKKTCTLSDRDVKIQTQGLIFKNLSFEAINLLKLTYWDLMKTLIPFNY